MSTHHVQLNLPFVSESILNKEVPRKLQSSTLLMKILVQIRLLKHFEVFTPEITLVEEKILHAQEVIFIEISVDQHNVFEVEENANCTVDDIHYLSAVQVFDPFTSHVELIQERIKGTEKASHIHTLFHR